VAIRVLVRAVRLLQNLIDEMQHDAVAAAADGMGAELDGSPSPLSLAWSICPAAPGKSQNLAENLSSFHGQAAMQAQHCLRRRTPRAFQVSISPATIWFRFNFVGFGLHHRTQPHDRGIERPHWLSTITAFGVMPCFFTASPPSARIVLGAGR